MAGYIIIKNAMNSERKRAEDEIVYEQEMIRKGYRKEMKLTNPETCYAHVYRSIRMRTTGNFFLLLTALMGWYVAVVKDNPAILLTTFVVSIILFVCGLFLSFSTRIVHNDKKYHEEIEGYKFLRTESHHRYEYEWVYKDKSKPSIEERKALNDWVEQNKKNRYKDGK